MARIKNLDVYPNDTLPTLSDRVIGTDSDSNNKTKNYRIADIVSLIEGGSLRDGVISGSVVWVEDLDYLVSDLEVVIGGVFYNVPGATVTLTDAHPTNQRIDLITAKVSISDSRPAIKTAAINVIDGVSAPDPVKPTIPDHSREIQITFADVGGGATEPTGVSRTSVYDENVGSPTEWDVTETTSATGIILDSTTNPNTGTKCIAVTSSLISKFDSVTPDSITFTASTLVDITTVDSLHLYIRLNSDDARSSGEDSIVVKLSNSTTQIASLVRIENGVYGLDTNLFDIYQSIVIPIDAFEQNIRGVSLNIENINFKFEGAIGQTFNIDTFDLVGGVNNPPMVDTWLGLADTDDTEYTGKLGYRSTVNSNESGLELTPSGLQDGVVTGGVVWTSGLIYEVSDLLVVIDGSYYNIAGTTVTLDAADVSNPRIDIITVNIEDIRTAPLSVIQVIKGDATTFPVKPVIPDSTVEIEVTFVEIGVNATEPTNISDDLIYDENVGSSVEWDVTESTSGVRIELASTESPNTGTKSIKLLSTITSGDTITFTSDSTHDIKDISTLHFYVKLQTNARGNKGEIKIRLHSGATLLSTVATLKDGAYGLNTKIFNVYQSIIIPIEDFNFLSTSGTTSINKITFETSDKLADEVFIDTFKLITGVNTPTSVTTWIGLEDTDDNAYTNKSGYRPSVNSSEAGLELTPSGLQDGVVTGGVVWTSGLVYEVSDLLIILGGVYYNVVGATVTLDAADVGNPRIDIITVNPFRTTPISFIKGTAAASPVKPLVPDSSVELEVTFVEIGTGASTPTGVSDDLIYDENVGSPTEWDVTENTSGVRVELASTEAPNAGTKSIKLLSTSTNGDTVTFTSDSTHAVKDVSTLHFYVRLAVDSERYKGSIGIRLYDGATSLSTQVHLKNGVYGLNTNLFNVYQSIIIPIEDFKLFKPHLSNTITNIVFSVSSKLANEVFIDTFKLIAGVNTPKSTETWLGLLDTDDTTYAGKAGYVSTVNLDESGLELKSTLDRVNDVGNVSSAQVIDWEAYETWDYVQTAAVTFTESNTPATGFSKTITVYISGNFTPVIPASWTVKTGTYDGTADNQYVVEWVKSGKVWCHINN